MREYKFAYCFPIQMGMETVWSSETEENLLTRRFAVGHCGTTAETHEEVTNFIKRSEAGDLLCVGTGVIIRQRD